MKLRRAARELSEQISQQPARFAEAGELIMRVDGNEVTIPTERISFNPHGTTRVGVVPTRSSSCAGPALERGGYVETYPRIGVAVETSALSQLTNLLFAH